MKNKKLFASLATATILANTLANGAVTLADATAANQTQPSTTASTVTPSASTSVEATTESTTQRLVNTSESSSSAATSSSSSTAPSSSSSSSSQDNSTSSSSSSKADTDNSSSAGTDNTDKNDETGDSSDSSTTQPSETENVFTVNFVDASTGKGIGTMTQTTSQATSTFALPKGYVTVADTANGFKAGQTSVTLTLKAPKVTVKIQKSSTDKPSTPSTGDSSKPNHSGSNSNSSSSNASSSNHSKGHSNSRPNTTTQQPAAPVTPAPAAPAPTTDLPPITSQPELVPAINDVIYTYDYSNDTAKFIASIAEQSRVIAKDNNLYASVMIAQAILESGSGGSTLSQAPNYNLFGIKGEYNKQSVTMATLEDNGLGSLYAIQAKFKRYDNTSESLLDYAHLLKNGIDGNKDIYAAAWKTNAKTYEDATKALQGKYATDTQYAAKLNGLIKKYDLTKYDKNTNYATAQYSVENVENQDVFAGKAGKIKDFKDTNFTGKTVAGQTLDAQNDTVVRLLSTATSQLGVPYVWSGATFSTTKTKGALDCSGLVQQSYLKALGIKLPRTSQEQSQLGTSIKVDVKDLQPGDLLFVGQKDAVHHVAMYLTNGYFIEAPQPGGTVQIGNIKDEHFDFAKRIISSTKKNTVSVKAEVNYMKASVSARKTGNLTYGEDTYYTPTKDGNFKLTTLKEMNEKATENK